MFGKNRLNKERPQINPKLNEELKDALPFVTEAVRVGRKAPQEYEVMLAKQRDALKKSKSDNARELLCEVIEYSNSNGRVTPIKVSLKGNLYEELSVLSDENLREVHSLLMFAHDPFCPSCKKTYSEGTTQCLRCDVKLQRFIVSIPAHEKMNHVIMILEDLMVGFTEELALEKLTKELNNDSFSLEEKRVIGERIREMRRHLERKLKEHERRVKVIKPPEVPEIPQKHVCEGCNNEFKNAGGLGSHKKACELFKTLKEA